MKTEKEKNIEDTFIDKFELNDHPLFRTKEDAEKLSYNLLPLPHDLDPTYEQRILPSEQSQYC